MFVAWLAQKQLCSGCLTIVLPCDEGIPLRVLLVRPAPALLRVPGEVPVSQLASIERHCVGTLGNPPLRFGMLPVLLGEGRAEIELLYPRSLHGPF